MQVLIQWDYIHSLHISIIFRNCENSFKLWIAPQEPTVNKQRELSQVYMFIKQITEHEDTGEIHRTAGSFRIRDEIATKLWSSRNVQPPNGVTWEQFDLKEGIPAGRSMCSRLVTLVEGKSITDKKNQTDIVSSPI